MEHFMQTAKAHPYVIGGGVAVGALLIFFMFKKPAATGGTYAVANGQDTTNAQINAQLVMAQDALSAQGNQAAIALQAKENDNATAIQLAQGANATSLAGAQINATTLLAQGAMAQQTSLLTLAAQTGLAAQQTGLEYNLENTALQYQHANDVNSAQLNLQKEYDNERNALPNQWTFILGSNPDGSPTSHPEGGMNAQGGWSQTGPGTPTSVAPIAAAPNAVTSSYLDNITSLLQSINHKVMPGDPTATATST